MQKTSLRPAVFFDRDGVLNVDINYAYRPDQITWVKGAMEALRLAREAGYFTFVVTNQAGVARGLYTENDVQNLHDWMQTQFQAAGCVGVDAFAYCPHHPSEGNAPYKMQCECRKPKPGMLLQLMQRFPVDAQRSFLIGDHARDMGAAEAAGIKGYLFDAHAQGANLAEFIKMYL